MNPTGLHAPKAQEQQLIDAFKGKGVKFVASGRSLGDLRATVKPMQTELPEVWNWAQRLSALTA